MDIIVDTLSFRLREMSYEKLVDFLCIEGLEIPWKNAGRFNRNYPESYLYEGIRIGYNGENGWDIYVHMSGKGCRTYEDLMAQVYPRFNWYSLIQDISRLQKGIDDKGNKYPYPLCSVTRIDLACDERENILRLNRLEDYIIHNKYSSRCPASSIRLVKFGEECLYVGSSNSLTLLRIYNKKLERGYSSDDDSIEPWHRAELQLRDSHAVQIVNEWSDSNDVGSVYSGHLIEHIRFLKSPNKKDGNQHRLEVAKWWSDFCNNSERLQWVSVKGSEYNKSRLERYAIGNAGSSVKTLILSQQLSPELLHQRYTDASINLRDDQKDFIFRCTGVRPL